MFHWCLVVIWSKRWNHWRFQGRPRSNFFHFHRVSGNLLRNNRFAHPLSVADPGFFPGGCANFQNCYYFSNFCRKLHENERIWTPGGARAWRPPLDLPMPLGLTPLLRNPGSATENLRVGFSLFTEPKARMIAPIFIFFKFNVMYQY